MRLDDETSPFPTFGALLLAAMLLAAGTAALSIDLPLSHAVLAPSDGGVRIPGDLRRFFDLCEVFAHGLGVAMFLAAIAVLDPAGRARLPRIACCAYLGGVVAISLKLLIVRIRPMEFDFAGDVWSTFLAVRPWFDQATAAAAAGLSGRDVQSFPSGHAATAAAFAAALAWRYPHGTWLFALFALLAGVQRITSGAHFASDVLCGAALGLAFAACCLDRSLLGGWFDSVEGWFAEQTTEVDPPGRE